MLYRIVAYYAVQVDVAGHDRSVELSVGARSGYCAAWRLHSRTAWVHKYAIEPTNIRKATPQ